MIYFPLDQWHPPGGNRHFLAMPVLQVQAAEAAVDAGDARAMQRMTGPLKTALKRKAFPCTEMYRFCGCLTDLFVQMAHGIYC